MTISNETKVGAFAAVTITILILGYNFLRGVDLFSTGTKYYAVYENVAGLHQSNPIELNGFHIGQVSKLSLAANGSRNIVAVLSITEKVKLPSNSMAKIKSDLLGNVVIEIIPGDSQIMAKSGDTLIAAIQPSFADAVSKEMAPIKAKAENLLDQIDSVLVIVQYFLNEKSQASFHASFANLEIAIANFRKSSAHVESILADNKEKMSTIFSNVESITRNFKENEEQLNRIMTNTAAITDSIFASDLKQTVNNANTALAEFAQILEQVNTGQGSIGMLLQDDKLYNNLESSAHNLDELFIDIKTNPRRYVKVSLISFEGKKNKKNKKK